jgi:murein DD-endopeptidase MepM/ murein hydrolase activator NlpD
MTLPRRTALTLALTLPLAALNVAGCVARVAPPAPVIAGQSAAARPEPLVAAPAPVMALAAAPVTMSPPPPVVAAPLPPSPRQPVEIAELPATVPAVSASAPPASPPPPPERPLPERHADVAPVPSGSTRRVPPHPDHVTVRAGETLYAISRRYGVPVRSLIEANGLTPPYAVAAGRHLALPQVRIHVVQPGETLYSVSRAYGLETTTLARSNALPPPYTVFVGETLVLPASVQTADAGATAAAPPAAAEPMPPAPEAKPLPPAKIEPSAGPGSHTELAALPPPRIGGPGATNGRFLWPIRGHLVSDYGTGEGGTRNDGINIAAPAGTTVLAADAGIVAYAGNELRGYGNLVLIKHANGWMTAYAHNSALLVKRGEKVRRGQPIARVGSTGAVNRPQLHFEIRHGAKALDPGDYLPGGTTSVNG